MRALEWRPEVDFRCLCQLLSYCVLRQGLFLNLELADSALLENPKGPLVSASPMQGSQAHATPPHFNMGAMELNVGPYACAISILVLNHSLALVIYFINPSNDCAEV